MSEERPGAPSPRLEPGSLASFLAFLWRHRFLVVGFTGLATLATVVYVLAVPVRYTARATLLPQTKSGAGLLSVAAAMSGGGLPFAGLAGLSPESAIQEGILRSERLADAVNEEFHLDARYKVRNREERLRAWQANLGTGTNQQGLLSVSFTDRDPEFAAKVLARLIDHLDTFNRETRSTASRRTRVFVEKRLVEARARMGEMEQTLVDYQAAHASLALSPTTEAVVAAGAGILAQRIRLQMEIQMLREGLAADAPAVREKQAEIVALDRQMDRLPALNSELAGMLRDLRVRERTYGYLSAQLEEARIEEARDTPTVDLLDPPVVPEEKSWPLRTVTVLAVFGVSGLLSLLLARLFDAARDARRAVGVDRG